MNKRTVYSFVMPNLPMPTLFNRRQTKEVIKLLDGLKGLVAITPHWPEGTLLYFDTLNHAKVARNKIEAAGPNRCGQNIMVAEVTDDMQSVTILGKAEDEDAKPERTED